MTGMKHTNCTANRLKRLMKWPLLCGLLACALARTASGQQALYDNESVLQCPPATIPTIDATNFLNNNIFTIDFPSSSFLNLYETRDTLNYTNNGLMTCNNGFRFDDYNYTSGFHSNAASFYNAGTIRVGSEIDGNFSIDGYPPEFIVSATNIANSGTVVVGQNGFILSVLGNVETIGDAGGLLQFTGQDVDLTRSTLTVENLNSIDNLDSSVSGNGGFGTDTNGDWVPSEELQPTYAISSFASPATAIFPPYPYLYLTNSTCYFETNFMGTNTITMRAVFIQNNNPIPYNVYIDGNIGLGVGATTIEWLGSYVDSATGNTFTNYLYLNDDYALGSYTNLFLINGIPDNFAFTESATRLAGNNNNAAVSAYPTNMILPMDEVVTNTYSYATAQFIATSVDTNSVVAGLTNMPGRVQINASGSLNLSLSTISGMNYLSLNATNQYDGSTNARISAPYTDISIGRTNGFMNVSNLTESAIPFWNGTVQCWSGHWDFVDTNGVTNDFRVLIVGSQISPTTPSQALNLSFYAKTNLVISDAFSILSSFYTDAQSLTLTTNDVGNGAESPAGELNLESPALFWANCVPNLLNLTNNGTILLQNNGAFGATNRYYHNFITTGVISDQGSQVWAENFYASGIFSNNVSSFGLQSTNAVLANLSLTSGGDVSIGSGSVLVTNLYLQAGRSLTLSSSNILTDGTVSGSTILTNGGIWTVGANAISGQSVLSMPVFPTNGISLLGTTITNIAPTNKNVIVTWAGRDYGASSAGFTNNGAIGRLILDAQGTVPQFGVFTFNGAGVSNAIYVDYLEFDDAAANETSYNFPALSINTNITIYFAQAVINGVSVAGKIDIASRYNGANNGRLRWVPTYGATNTFNAALAQSTDDSDGDGIANGSDPTPFFLSSELSFTETLTNVPPLSVLLSWQTVPNATNFVYYKTNLASANWSLLQTNFSLPVNPFISPQPYGSPATSVSVLDTNPPPRYYKVTVQPWLTYPN
jgi:hypothetical protein